MTDPFLPQFKANEEAAISPMFFLHEGVECVRVLKAGDSRNIPVFRAADVCGRGDMGEEITYADRWPNQYAQFKQGFSQVADGTPLEQAPFLNPSRIADLRALKIFSVEGLAQFDDRYITKLGGHGYKLKEMAQEFVAKRAVSSTGALEKQIAAMQEQIARLTSGSEPVYAPATIDDDPRTDDELKEAIFAKHGTRPRGPVKRETMLNMLAQDAAAA